MENPFEGFIKKIKPEKIGQEDRLLGQKDENPYAALRPREDLQQAYDLLGVLFNNYYRLGLEDHQQLKAALESCTDDELRNLYEAIEVKMDRGLFRPKDAGVKQEEFDQENTRWARFCDLVDKLVMEVYSGRKK